MAEILQIQWIFVALCICCGDTEMVQAEYEKNALSGRPKNTSSTHSEKVETTALQIREAREKRHMHELPHFYPKIYLHPGYHHHDDHGDHHHGYHHHEHHPHMEEHEYDENGEYVEYGSGPEEHHLHEHHDDHHPGRYHHMEDEHHSHSGHHPMFEEHDDHNMIDHHYEHHHHPIHHHEHSGHEIYDHGEEQRMHGEGDMGDVDVGGGYFQLEEKGGGIDIVALKRTGTKVKMGGGEFNVIRDPWRQHSLFAGLFHPHERPPNLPIGQLHQHFTYISNDRRENHNVHEYLPVTHHLSDENPRDVHDEEQGHDRSVASNAQRRHHKHLGRRLFERLLRKLSRPLNNNHGVEEAQRHDLVPEEDKAHENHEEQASGNHINEEDNFQLGTQHQPRMFKVLEIPLQPLVKRSYIGENNTAYSIG